MNDAAMLQTAMTFLELDKKELEQMFRVEGAISRSTIHRWLSGEVSVPAALKLLLKERILAKIPCAQKPEKTMIIMVCGNGGGIGSSPFAVTLAQFLHDFGLKSACYHAGRDPIDENWSVIPDLWLTEKFQIEKPSKDKAYLRELNKILAEVGAGQRGLDCLVIDVPRRLERMEHYENVMCRADAAITLVRSWSPDELRTHNRIAATGTAVKTLVNIKCAWMTPFKDIDLGEKPMSQDELKKTYFDGFLIDSRLSGRVGQFEHLRYELTLPPEERISPLMRQCEEVTMELLEMLGLRYIESSYEAWRNCQLPSLAELLQEIHAYQIG